MLIFFSFLRLHVCRFSFSCCPLPFHLWRFFRKNVYKLLPLRHFMTVHDHSFIEQMSPSLFLLVLLNCNCSLSQGWACSDFFEIVPFCSKTRAFSQIVPFSFLFFNRSILGSIHPIPFFYEQKNGHPVLFHSWHSQWKNGSIPLVPFLGKNDSIPRFVLSQERFHPCSLFFFIENGLNL